jgi:hypothetical protein
MSGYVAAQKNLTRPTWLLKRLVEVGDLPGWKQGFFEGAHP